MANVHGCNVIVKHLHFSALILCCIFSNFPELKHEGATFHLNRDLTLPHLVVMMQQTTLRGEEGKLNKSFLPTPIFLLF